MDSQFLRQQSAGEPLVQGLATRVVVCRLTGSHSAVLWDSADEDNADVADAPLQPVARQDSAREHRPVHQALQQHPSRQQQHRKQLLQQHHAQQQQQLLQQGELHSVDTLQDDAGLSVHAEQHAQVAPPGHHTERCAQQVSTLPQQQPSEAYHTQAAAYQARHTASHGTADQPAQQALQQGLRQQHAQHGFIAKVKLRASFTQAPAQPQNSRPTSTDAAPAVGEHGLTASRKQGTVYQNALVGGQLQVSDGNALHSNVAPPCGNNAQSPAQQLSNAQSNFGERQELGDIDAADLATQQALLSPPHSSMPSSHSGSAQKGGLVASRPAGHHTLPQDRSDHTTPLVAQPIVSVCPEQKSQCIAGPRPRSAASDGVVTDFATLPAASPSSQVSLDKQRCRTALAFGGAPNMGAAPGSSAASDQPTLKVPCAGDRLACPRSGPGSAASRSSQQGSLPSHQASWDVQESCSSTGTPHARPATAAASRHVRTAGQGFPQSTDTRHSGLQQDSSDVAQTGSAARNQSTTPSSSHAVHAVAAQISPAMHARSTHMPADLQAVPGYALQQVQAVNSAVCLSLRDEASCNTLLSREGLEQDNTRLRHALSAIEQQLSMLKQDFKLHQVTNACFVYGIFLM